MAKKANNAKVLRYKVTQPVVRGKHGNAQFPEFTTRIGSNAHYIFAANHPDWYEAARREEDRMIEQMSEAALRALFNSERRLLAEMTPVLLYGFVLIRLLRRYVDSYMPNQPLMRDALNNALATVANNLALTIFQDPRNLTGDRYTVVDFLRWHRNLEAFEGMDVFSYRPPELGKDTDGKRKPILELCPAPRLGRHLVRAGYAILVDFVAERNAGQAALARAYLDLQAPDAPMCPCPTPRQAAGPSIK